MKTLCMMIGLLWGSFAFADSASPANTHLLKETVLQEFTLVNVSLSDAIAELRELTKTKSKQVNFVIPPETEALSKEVTLDLRGVSGLDAFAMILRQTATHAEIRMNSIWILPNP
ncbi:hypothetical protein P3T73_16850 [Kiritimatiellota bacterium B12222]|nr:hypothetical protein P3T73_16850 [Kiritimatiellota bacterium B12222]